MCIKEAEVLAEGKTKRIHATKDDSFIVIIESKDEITAGDGAKKDTIVGKGALSTTTTCNVFRLLNECGIRTAFREQISPIKFIAEKCDMIPLEVVVRREGHGSYLERNPHHKKGVLSPKLLVEFYLKTSNRKWDDKDIPVDDPLMEFVYEDGLIAKTHFYDPHTPISAQKPFMILKHFPFKLSQSVLDDIENIARNVFLILERAWWLEDFRLVDFKLEFGFNNDRKLVLADVIDSDSWRLVQSGEYQDKQFYRDGGSLNEVTKKYTRAADTSKRFKLPRQRIILWKGSETDDISELLDEHGRFCKMPDCEIRYHVRSMHKQPVAGIDDLHNWVQGTFENDIGCVNTVIIAYVGMSNGAGPILAANTHVPVITCSPSVKDFPEDIWSSLRMPSKIPLMTVLSPKNAMLAAIVILAIRSPRLYAILRREIEDRM